MSAPRCVVNSQPERVYNNFPHKACQFTRAGRIFSDSGWIHGYLRASGDCGGVERKSSGRAPGENLPGRRAYDSPFFLGREKAKARSPHERGPRAPARSSHGRPSPEPARGAHVLPRAQKTPERPPPHPRGGGRVGARAPVLLRGWRRPEERRVLRAHGGGDGTLEQLRALERRDGRDTRSQEIRRPRPPQPASAGERRQVSVAARAEKGQSCGTHERRAVGDDSRGGSRLRRSGRIRALAGSLGGGREPGTGAGACAVLERR